MKNISGSLSKAKKVEAKIISTGFRTYMEDLFAGRILKHSDFDTSFATDNPVKWFEQEPHRKTMCVFSRIVYHGDRFMLEGPKKVIETKAFTLVGATMKAVREIEAYKEKALSVGLLFVTVPQITFKKTLFGYKVLASFRNLEGVAVTYA